MPPVTKRETPQAPVPAKNIVEVADSAGGFNTLLGAVKAAGLLETLSEDGPFTVLAPTDKAFPRIAQEELNALLADKKAPTAFPTVHSVAGKVYAKDPVNLTAAASLNGQSAPITVRDGKGMVDATTVVRMDAPFQTRSGSAVIATRILRIFPGPSGASCRALSVLVLPT